MLQELPSFRTVVQSTAHTRVPCHSVYRAAAKFRSSLSCRTRTSSSDFYISGLVEVEGFHIRVMLRSQPDLYSKAWMLKKRHGTKILRSCQMHKHKSSSNKVFLKRFIKLKFKKCYSLPPGVRFHGMLLYSEVVTTLLLIRVGETALQPWFPGLR